ncbi:MAG TPA: hypothetical protein VH331_04015 [Allosphingosinicella sp.]|jgi:hypothetical protein|nr:hypothetical protein [Allosphingosinicella sp.]
MASADDGTYYIQLEGASEDALRRGLAAGRAVYERAGADPRDCARASFKREGRDLGDEVEITRPEHDLADLWWQAADAAFAALAVADWERRDPNFGLWDAEEANGRVTLGSPFAPPARIEPHVTFQPPVPELQ